MKLCSELVSQAAVALSHLICSVHLWTDSQVVLKWITNPDLRLVRFAQRRVDKILSFFAQEALRYVTHPQTPQMLLPAKMLEKILNRLNYGLRDRPCSQKDCRTLHRLVPSQLFIWLCVIRKQP